MLPLSPRDLTGYSKGFRQMLERVVKKLNSNPTHQHPRNTRKNRSLFKSNAPPVSESQFRRRSVSYGYKMKDEDEVTPNANALQETSFQTLRRNSATISEANYTHNIQPKGGLMESREHMGQISILDRFFSQEPAVEEKPVNIYFKQQVRMKTNRNFKIKLKVSQNIGKTHTIAGEDFSPWEGAQPEVMEELMASKLKKQHEK